MTINFYVVKRKKNIKRKIKDNVYQKAGLNIFNG